MSSTLFVFWDIETCHKKGKWITKEIERDIEHRASMIKTSDESLTKEAAFHLTTLTNPHFSDLLCISYKCTTPSGEVIEPTKTLIRQSADEDERVMLRHFIVKCIEWSVNFRRVCYIGYNSIYFDSWYLFQKAIIHGLKFKHDKHLGIFDFRRYQTYPQFDIMQVMANWDAKHYVKLSTLCHSLGIKMDKKLNMHKDGVFQLADLWTQQDIKAIKEYSQEDVNLTEQVFFKIQRYFDI